MAAIPPPDRSTAATSTTILAEEVDGELASGSAPVLRLRLQKPKTDKKVAWRDGTVDNEHMGKKKSKCCCIYKKPTKFGESSSSDDEDCEHCFGHPEKRKKNKKHHDHDHEHDPLLHERIDGEVCEIHGHANEEQSPISVDDDDQPSTSQKHVEQQTEIELEQSNETDEVVNEEQTTQNPEEVVKEEHSTQNSEEQTNAVEEIKDSNTSIPEQANENVENDTSTEKPKEVQHTTNSALGKCMLH